jgi:hypothetical protein
MSDIGRMTIGFWPGQPHLTDAVLDGYGRRLSADDKATATCLFAVNAVKFIVLGTELGKRDFAARTRHVLRQLDPCRPAGSQPGRAVGSSPSIWPPRPDDHGCRSVTAVVCCDHGVVSA